MPYIDKAEDRLSRVEGRYDPEHDVPTPPDPQVTWADIYLVAAMRAVLAECKYIKQKMEELERKIAEVEQWLR